MKYSLLLITILTCVYFNKFDINSIDSSLNLRQLPIKESVDLDKGRSLAFLWSSYNRTCYDARTDT